MNVYEKDYLLKYFYLIDSERFVESIADTPIYKCFCENPDEYCTDFFHMLFTKILDASSLYTDFVYSPDTFNYSNGDGNIHALNGYSCLMTVVLRNHCILNGFLSLLESGEDLDQVKISGKNHDKIRKGHFGAKSTPNSDDQNRDESIIFQTYNGNKKRFNQNTMNYSNKILRAHSIRLDNGFPVAPSYAANWLCFLFNEPLVNTLDKNIMHYTKGNSRYPLIRQYSSLYEKCLEWVEINRSCPEDVLLFTQAMESFYGFSFFKSAAEFLNKIHSTPSDFSSMTLKDLEGEALLFNIQQAAQLPLTYNRHIFIEYGIYSVLTSRHLKDTFTPIKERSLISYIPAEESSKNQLTLNGLHLIESYLHRLKYIAIPLMQDLWEVMISKLNNKHLTSANVRIDLGTYRSYIQKNYSLLTNDYTGMSEEQLSRVTEHTLSEPENVLESVDSYRPCNYYKIPSTKYERESLEHLLDGYFVFERFDETQRGCSNVLIDSLQSENGLNRYNSIKLQFYKNHKDNITTFCRGLPPLCVRPQKSTDSTEPPIPQDSESI